MGECERNEQKKIQRRNQFKEILRGNEWHGRFISLNVCVSACYVYQCVCHPYTFCHVHNNFQLKSSSNTNSHNQITVISPIFRFGLLLASLPLPLLLIFTQNVSCMLSVSSILIYFTKRHAKRCTAKKKRTSETQHEMRTNGNANMRTNEMCSHKAVEAPLPCTSIGQTFIVYA